MRLGLNTEFHPSPWSCPHPVGYHLPAPEPPNHMTDQTPEQKLDALLSGISNEKPCIVERNKPLAKALRHFIKLAEAGETRVPLEHLYLKQGMQELFDGPSMNSVRRWVQKEKSKHV